MLHLYVGDSSLIPKDLKFIKDAEAEFVDTKLRDDEFTRTVLRELEQAEYVDEEVFKDRFGRELYSSCLSTGLKTLLLLAYNPTAVVDCNELGISGWGFLSLLKDGYAYFENREFEYHPFDGIEEYRTVEVNGLICNSYVTVNAVIGGYFCDDEEDEDDI